VAHNWFGLQIVCLILSRLRGHGLTWKLDAKLVSFTIPAAAPSGDYLVRVEHIGLHVAQSAGAAQFYLSCGQITVTGGGSGTPGPLVAFPGAYSATDPGILIAIYYPIVSISPWWSNVLG
jgi:hypothetical protein